MRSLRDLQAVVFGDPLFSSVIRSPIWRLTGESRVYPPATLLSSLKHIVFEKPKLGVAVGEEKPKVVIPLEEAEKETIEKKLEEQCNLPIALKGEGEFYYAVSRELGEFIEKKYLVFGVECGAVIFSLEEYLNKSGATIILKTKLFSWTLPNPALLIVFEEEPRLHRARRRFSRDFFVSQAGSHLTGIRARRGKLVVLPVVLLEGGYLPLITLRKMVRGSILEDVVFKTKSEVFIF